MVRSEYPRPQLRRGEDSWLNLNGKWEFEIDHGNSGVSRGMFSADAKYGREIVVPFCPESKLSGIENKDFMRCVWYRRQCALKPEWDTAKGRVLVNFYVETDGTVSERKVVKAELKNRLSDKKFSKYSDIDKYAMREQGEGELKDEALRVVGKMPNWKPAMRRGKLVRVKYTLPITFKVK